jgi:hypothetical protein
MWQREKREKSRFFLSHWAVSLFSALVIFFGLPRFFGCLESKFPLFPTTCLPPIPPLVCHTKRGKGDAPIATWSLQLVLSERLEPLLYPLYEGKPHCSPVFQLAVINAP